VRQGLTFLLKPFNCGVSTFTFSKPLDFDICPGMPGSEESCVCKRRETKTFIVRAVMLEKEASKQAREEDTQSVGFKITPAERVGTFFFFTRGTPHPRQIFWSTCCKRRMWFGWKMGCERSTWAKCPAMKPSCKVTFV
jgi:hypothetical protein